MMKVLILCILLNQISSSFGRPNLSSDTSVVEESGTLNNATDASKAIEDPDKPIDDKGENEDDDEDDEEDNYDTNYNDLGINKPSDNSTKGLNGTDTEDRDDNQDDKIEVSPTTPTVPTMLTTSTTPKNLGYPYKLRHC